MSFARKVWHLIVAVKDGLSLLFLLLFFFALYAVLTARPSPAAVRDGALLIDLDGIIVEEKSQPDLVSTLLSGQVPAGEYDVQDLVHALDAAATDDRIKAVVLDLSRFVGGGQVHIEDVGAALDRVRAARKPVLTWAVAYTDSGVMLASHASEVWVDPLGGAVITGPGGNRLYYGELLRNLDVNARIYKVGTYKSAVEPYYLNEMSEPARENYAQLYGALWSEWQANVAKARPKAQVAAITADPVGWLQSAGFDPATAAKKAGLVDQLGDKVAFGQRVARIVGEDKWDDSPGAYARTELDPWLADNPLEKAGGAIGVVTIAGNIVDGEAGPGTAGGDRIAQVLDDALDDDLKGLVVRVDSPGGSVMASEAIRRAIMRHKAKGIPVAVSMANVAASGGYWVSTPAQRIFAEPSTITGSIGIFAVVPTFERAAARWGLNADGVKTTPLSGQPDLVSGFTPEVDALLQGYIENGYGDFITRVAQSRKMTRERVDAVGQGRVWDGGTARQIGLVDQHGGLQDALAWVAGQAKLGDGDWHAEYLGEQRGVGDTLLRQLLIGESERSAGASDVFGVLTARRQSVLAQLAGDADRLTRVQGMQAYCLECAGTVQRADEAALSGWVARLIALVA
ncbi:signal peptide peptidase SppA [Altererythrobacter sp. TH136]|uniref:signal peptide peptidase SppA n=1 Tax=Altererythrobacter sp. TH136 TaxID=2067415 RepID=UPI0011655375|nr:signal peptide peptidase SppA [Altererythrobacter sp. TH136]QDM41526.1 signal peptide peptidase SppA [Altererythrobacter sp. TH136]